MSAEQPAQPVPEQPAAVPVAAEEPKKGKKEKKQKEEVKEEVKVCVLLAFIFDCSLFSHRLFQKAVID